MLVICRQESEFSFAELIGNRVCGEGRCQSLVHDTFNSVIPSSFLAVDQYKQGTIAMGISYEVCQEQRTQEKNLTISNKVKN